VSTTSSIRLLVFLLNGGAGSHWELASGLFVIDAHDSVLTAKRLIFIEGRNLADEAFGDHLKENASNDKRGCACYGNSEISRLDDSGLEDRSSKPCEAGKELDSEDAD